MNVYAETKIATDNEKKTIPNETVNTLAGAIPLYFQFKLLKKKKKMCGLWIWKCYAIDFRVCVSVFFFFHRTIIADRRKICGYVYTVQKIFCNQRLFDSRILFTWQHIAYIYISKDCFLRSNNVDVEWYRRLKKRPRNAYHWLLARRVREH